MAMHKALMEMVRVSGSMFILLFIASTIVMLLLSLLVVSLVRFSAKNNGVAKQACHN